MNVSVSADTIYILVFPEGEEGDEELQYPVDPFTHTGNEMEDDLDVDGEGDLNMDIENGHDDGVSLIYVFLSVLIHVLSVDNSFLP